MERSVYALSRRHVDSVMMEEAGHALSIVHILAMHHLVKKLRGEVAQVYRPCRRCGLQSVEQCHVRCVGIRLKTSRYRRNVNQIVRLIDEYLVSHHVYQVALLQQFQKILVSLRQRHLHILTVVRAAVDGAFIPPTNYQSLHLTVCHIGIPL